MLSIKKVSSCAEHFESFVSKGTQFSLNLLIFKHVGFVEYFLKVYIKNENFFSFT